jgi:Flp pilus assembly pilin Flp
MTQLHLSAEFCRLEALCKSNAHIFGDEVKRVFNGGMKMTNLFRKLWSQEEAQDIAEYAVMLAVILVIVVGTLRLIGGHANNVFSSVASSIGQ